MQTAAPLIGVAALCLVAGMASGARVTPEGTDGARACTVARIDTLQGIVYGNLDVRGPGAVAPDAYREYLSHAVRGIAAAADDTIRLRQAQGVPEWVVVYLGKAARPTGSSGPLLPVWPGHPALTTEIGFAVRSGGGISSPRVVVPGDSIITAQVLRAIARAGAQPWVSPIPGNGPGDSLVVVLRLTLRPDSAATASQPLFAAVTLQQDGKPVRARPRNEMPRYPDWGRGAAFGAVVVVWYDVDEHGEVVPGTVDAAAPAAHVDPDVYSSFVRAVEQVVPRWRFYPAEVGGCAVRRQVVQVVKFIVGR